MRLARILTGWMIFSMLCLPPSSRADFSGDLARRTADPATLATPKLPGIPMLGSANDLDFSKPLTLAEKNQVLEALQAVLDPPTAAQVRSLVARLDNGYANYTHLVIFLGINVGYLLGIDTNFALLFGHDPFTGQLSVAPSIITRVQLVSLGTDVHVGAGLLYSDRPAIQWGLTLGGAYVMGAGIGESRNSSGSHEVWIEIKAGLGAQIGPYFEFML